MQLLSTLHQQHFHSKQQLLHSTLAVAPAVAVGALLGQSIVEQRNLKVQNVKQAVFLLDDQVLVFGQLVGDVERVLKLDAFVADPRQ